MNQARPYIGCKIALISKAQNRYVGILYTVDVLSSTVVLAKVKCFGTEGRLTDRPTLRRDDVYEFITFRGSDISDISLCEPSPTIYGFPPDPAILLSSPACVPDAHATLNLGAVKVPIYHKPAPPLHNEHYAAALGIGAPLKRPVVEKGVQTIGSERNKRILLGSDEEWEQSASPARASYRHPQIRQPVRPPSRPLRDREPPRPRPPPINIRGGPRFPPSRPERPYRQNLENVPPRMRQGSWRGSNRRSDGPLRFDADFDFDLSNAQFFKDHDNKEVREVIMEEPIDSPFDPFGPKCVYNKAKSFYDNMSSPSEQRLRSSWAEERQRNMETFGTSGWPPRSPGLRGGQGRGRGQRSGQGVFVY
ncbi:unnamed protein product [Knipowitschia caucasica]